MSSPDCVFRLDVIRCHHPVVAGDTDDERCSSCEHRSIPKSRATTSMVKSYVSAEASLMIEGPVNETTFNERLTHCMNCPSRVAGDEKESVGYCNSCGCPSWNRSRLSVKLTMPKYECPLKKWGKANGVRPMVVDLLQSQVIKVLKPRSDQ